MIRGKWEWTASRRMAVTLVLCLGCIIFLLFVAGVVDAELGHPKSLRKDIFLIIFRGSLGTVKAKVAILLVPVVLGCFLVVNRDAMGIDYSALRRLQISAAIPVLALLALIILVSAELHTDMIFFARKGMTSERQCPPTGPLLTVDEFISRYQCRSEDSIEASMAMLSRANMTFNTSSISDFWEAWKTYKGGSVDHMFRIQIIKGKAFTYPFMGPWNGPITDTPSLNHRLVWVMEDILRLMTEVELPDVDLLYWGGDGWGEDALPASWPADKANPYGPVFAQEMTRGTRTMWMPPRSIHGCPDFAQQAAEDNSIKWSTKKAKAVFRGSTTGGVYDSENWERFPRSKAVLQSKEHPDLVDAGRLDFPPHDPHAKVRQPRSWRRDLSVCAGF